MGTEGSASAAAPERARWPRLAQSPRAELRALLPRGYAGFTEATEPSHLLLPASAAVPLIIKLRDSAWRPPQFVTGAHSSFSVVEGDCAPEYLEVWLAPLGAYTLLGLPPVELRGQTVDAGEVLGADGRRLAERVRRASTWRQRFGLVDEFLAGRLREGPRPAPEVGWAWRRLVATGGAVPIGRLAKEVGWSHKHLITRFRRQVGLAPKTVARLVRFDRVWRRLDAGGAVDWGLLAAEAGYADQAHLIREFRQFTGMTPTRFAARTQAARPDGQGEVQSVQDALLARS